MGDMADFINDDGWDDRDGDHYQSNFKVICDYCKQHNLHWVRVDSSRWRLATPTGKIHSCKAYLEKQRRIDVSALSRV